MSGNKGTVKIGIEIDGKGGVKILKSIGDESTKTGKKGKKSFNEMDTGAKKFSAGAKKASSAVLKIGAGVAGLLAVRAGLNALVSMTKEYVQISNVQIEAEKDLGAVLQATGNASGYNLTQLKAMASGMQAVTKVGDETTLSGMAILATFKKVRGEAFERSTKAALDMSQVMKQDVKSSMTMIGKAVNDPIVGLTALSRAGVTFSDGQKDMIKTLQESGDMMGAQNIILAELESQFGGAAEAAAMTFAGGMVQASNALGDAKEEMGFVITKNQFFIELTHLATEEFVRFGTAISNNQNGLMELAKDGVLVVVDSLGLGIETLRFFHNGWLGIKLVGNAAVHGLAIAMDELNPMMRSLMAPLDAIFQGLVKLGVLDVNPFDSMAKGLENFRLSSGDVTQDVLADIESTNQHYDTIRGTIQGWQDKIAQIPVSQVAADKETEKSSQNTLKRLSGMHADYTDDVIDDQNDITKSVKVSHADIIKGDLKMRLKIAQNSSKGAAKAIKDYEKQQKAQTREAKRTAAAIASAMDNMYRDIELKGQENYEYQTGLLEAQADKYRQMGIENELVERWFTEQHRQLKEEQTLDSNNFFAGVKIGLEEIERDMMTWAQAGESITNKMVGTMQSAFSDSLFAVIKGDIGSMSDVWSSAMDTMLKTLTDTVAKMVVEWAVTKAISWGTSALSGLFSYESGAWNIDPSTIGQMYPDSSGQPGIPAVVHEGEMIIPAGVAGGLRDRLEGHGISDFSGLTGSVGMTNDDFMSTFGKSFMGNMGLHGTGVTASAIDLSRQGHNIGTSDVVGAILSPDAMTKAAIGGITSAINNELGLTSMPGKVGQTIGSMIGSIIGGPAGSAILGVVGALVGTGIGDATDSRDYEDFRDSWESDRIDKAQGKYGDLFGAFGGWIDAQSDISDAISQVNNAHGTSGGFLGLGSRGVPDLNDPIGYDADYGFGELGPDFGDADDGETGAMGGMDDGPGPGTGMGGYATGGIINRLMVPRGEDGWAPVKFDEGVVSKPGMKTLDRINSGNFQPGDMRELVNEIHMLRWELKQKNHPIVRAVETTAEYTQILTRRPA